MTNRPPPPQDFDTLPIDAQIDYVQSLWDRIAAKPDRIPVPEWHRQVIEERLAAHEAPQSVRSWEEVRDDIKFQHRPER